MPFFGIGMKTDLFQSYGGCCVFQICWHIECSTFTASSFRIWNSSTEIPSHPLAFFIVMLPKAHLTSHSRMCGTRWVITPSWLSGSLRYFLYSSSVYFCHHLISSASVAAAAAMSLQSCLTLCDPIDGSPPGSAIPGILQGRTLEWVAISFSNAWKWKVKVKSFSRVRLLATPRTAAYHKLLRSWDFPGKSTGVGCHCPLCLHIWGYRYFSQQSWFQLVLHPGWHFTWCTLHIS